MSIELTSAQRASIRSLKLMATMAQAPGSALVLIHEPRPLVEGAGRGNVIVEVEGSREDGRRKTSTLLIEEGGCVAEVLI
jgi:hypothetical protein